jgi:acetolactate synthase-1/2/3 large subunit
MADAWGRLTGRPGVALLTAGPGHANGLSALFVAAQAESPLVLLSGHCPRSSLGRGGFQEMAQAHMAAPVTKASWTVTDSARIAPDLARAFRMACSGRPGPVHLSLPGDVLETEVDETGGPLDRSSFEPRALPLSDEAAGRIGEFLASAKRPIVLGGPATFRPRERKAFGELEAASGLPVVRTESPRGINDPSLGALAEVLPEADLVLLVGKKLDFTLRQGGPEVFAPQCRFLQVDADPEELRHTARVLDDASRLPFAAQADPAPAAERLAEAVAARGQSSDDGWRQNVEAVLAYRPPEWKYLTASGPERLHPVEVCRTLRGGMGASSVFVSDGGEFGQWAQACLSADRRVINGPSGAIGGGIPFALAAKLACPEAHVVATLGDGTFGYHALEFDTAVRYGIPFVAVVGNDAGWNAERVLQRRTYGPDRVVDCDLLATRYDRVAEALGGHGEHAACIDELAIALDRARRSNKPACVNVAIEPAAAPIIRRG